MGQNRGLERHTWDKYLSCTFTYVQANNQAIRDQKPIKKVQRTQKNENENENTPKSHKKLKNFTKRWVKRVYDFPPHLNLTMFSLGAEETQPNTEIPKAQNKDY